MRIRTRRFQTVRFGTRLIRSGGFVSDLRLIATVGRISKGADLIAPASIHWEIGNALSAMFKRNRIRIDQVTTALEAYNQIPIRFYDVGLSSAPEVAHRLNLYAYDAYVIACALKHINPVVSLDNGLLDAAHKTGADTVKIES